MGWSAGKTRQKGTNFKRLIDNKHRIHLSIEAQCVTTLLPLGDCHNVPHFSPNIQRPDVKQPISFKSIAMSNWVTQYPAVPLTEGNVPSFWAISNVQFQGYKGRAVTSTLHSDNCMCLGKTLQWLTDGLTKGNSSTPIFTIFWM